MTTADPPELWTFILSNLIVLILGSILTILSYQTYRRNGRRPLRVATFGFAAITVGALIEAFYQLGVRGSYELGGRELLALQTIEGMLIAIGLAALFYSIRGY
ncbi:MAG: hypothetical protein ABEH65_09235 [Halobacteriales archaeon]